MFIYLRSNKMKFVVPVAEGESSGGGTIELWLILFGYFVGRFEVFVQLYLIYG